MPDTSSWECPASLIANEPEMSKLVEMYLRGRTVREATGAPMFADQTKVPAKVIDALELLEGERQKVKAAAIKASAQ